MTGTKRDADRALAEALHQRDTGVDISPGKLTVADYLRRWLRDYAHHNVAPSTFARYEGIVQHHLIPSLGGLRLRDLRPAHIQSAYGRSLADGGRMDGAPGALSPRTVLKHHRLLHEALSHAVRWQLIARNPAEAVTAPRPERTQIRALSTDDAATLLRAARPTSLYHLIVLALDTGARLGELLALRWEDVDLDSGSLRIVRSVSRLPGQGIVYRSPKTHRSARPVALSPDIVSVLREHRRFQAECRLGLGRAYSNHGLIFAGPTGQPLDDSNLRRAFARIVADAGIPRLRFHDLRHTAATLMLRKGVHPKIVSERLGHATVGLTLDVYSHLLPDLQRDAAVFMDDLLKASLGPEVGSG